MGNRWKKEVRETYPGLGAINNKYTSTYYVRDAQGNVLSTYKRVQTPSNATNPENFYWQEAHIYGSSRVGVEKTNVLLVKKASGLQQPVYATVDVKNTKTRGNKRYELSNHLGNVLTVVADNRIAVVNGNTFKYYQAVIVSAQDYYPFGSTMPGREYANSSVTDSEYRFGFNGKELDSDWQSCSYDYGFRIYDARVCRFLSVDPLTASYPWYTPYQFAGNKPIACADLDGLEEWIGIDGRVVTCGPWSLKVGLEIVHNYNLEVHAQRAMAYFNIPEVREKLDVFHLMGSSPTRLFPSITTNRYPGVEGGLGIKDGKVRWHKFEMTKSMEVELRRNSNEGGWDNPNGSNYWDVIIHDHPNCEGKGDGFPSGTDIGNAIFDTNYYGDAPFYSLVEHQLGLENYQRFGIVVYNAELALSFGKWVDKLKMEGFKSTGWSLIKEVQDGDNVNCYELLKAAGVDISVMDNSKSMKDIGMMQLLFNQYRKKYKKNPGVAIVSNTNNAHEVTGQNDANVVVK